MQFRHSSHLSDHPFGCALSTPIMSINFIITGIQCSDTSVVNTSSKIKGSDKNCFNEASSGTSYTLAQDCLKCGLPFFVVVIIRHPAFSQQVPTATREIGIAQVVIQPLNAYNYPSKYSTYH